MFRKLCILGALLLVVSQVKGQNVSIKKVSETCRTEQKITEAEESDLENNWKPNMNAASVDRRVKCYLNCVLQGIHVVDASGQINWDKYMSLTSMDQSMRSGIVNCHSDQKSLTDPCEYAYGMYDCVMALKVRP